MEHTGSTSANLVTDSGEWLAPQGYSPVDDAYKTLAARQIGSSEYGRESVPYVVTFSSALVAYSGTTGGYAKYLSAGEQTTLAVTISTAADGLSGNVDLGSFKHVAINMSTAWTAADITFAASDVSTGTYCPVYDALGQEVVVTSTANRTIALNSIVPILAGLRHVKLRSGTLGTPVAQAASRALTLILKS